MRMNQRTVARGALIGSSLIAAVLIGGCQGGSAAGGSSASSLNVSPTTGPTSATTSVTSSGGASTPTASAGNSAPGSNACKAAGLKLTIGSGDAAAGHFYVPLELTNISSSSCVIQGFPGVSYVTGDNGTQVGQPATRSGPAGSPVTLAPGAVASSIVTVTDVAVFDASSCQQTPVRGFRVYAPGDTASLYVARSGTGCAGNPPSPQLQVQTVKAGAGSA